MNCNKCGTFNSEGSKFCIKCGNSLINANNIPNQINNMQAQNLNAQPIPQVGPVQTSSQVGINNVNNVQPQVNSNNVDVSMNYLKYMFVSLIKPIKTYKEENTKLTSFKNSFIVSIIVTCIIILANFIQTVINTVRVESFSFAGSSVTWEFERLKDLKYADLLGKNFLIYMGIIFGITIIFYLGSLVIKKNLNFNKTLGIVASSVLPVALGIFVLSPILGMIWSPLSIILTIVGFLYTFIWLYEVINMELGLENEEKMYFNLISFGIILIAIYFIYMNLFMGSMSDLGDLLDFFD